MGLGVGSSALLASVLATRTPASRRVARFGDSISANETSATSTAAKGILAQARAMSMGRFEFNHSLNYGVSGNTTSQALARLPAVIAAKPARINGLIGTNNITGDAANQQTWDDIRTMIDMCEAAGIPFDLDTVLARSYSLTPQRINRLYWLNEKIIREVDVRRSPFYNVIDIFSALVDKNASPLAEVANTTSDGLHVIGAGAQLCATVKSEFYNRIFGPQPVRLMTRDSLFNATDNPFGSLFSNPTCYGTGGTLGVGANIAYGVVMDGAKLERSSGATLVATGSKEADPGPNGGFVQVITLSGGGAGASSEYCRLLPTSNYNLTNVPIGTPLIAEFDVEQSGLSNVRNIRATLNETGGGATTGLTGSGIPADREIASTRRLIRTAAFVTTSQATAINCSLSIEADCTAAVAGAIKVRRFEIRPA